MLSDEYRQKENTTREAVRTALRLYQAKVEARMASNHSSVLFRDLTLGQQFVDAPKFVGDKPRFRGVKTADNGAIILESFTQTTIFVVGEITRISPSDLVFQVD